MSELETEELHEEHEAETSATMSEMEIDSDFQDKIVTHLLLDNDFCRRTRSLIKPEYFDNVGLQHLANIALSHYEDHGTPVGDLTILKQKLKDSIKKKSIREGTEKELVIEKTREIFTNPKIDNRDFVIEHVEQFAKRQAVENAVMKTVDLLDKKGNKWTEIYAALESAMNVRASTFNDAYDYFDKIEERSEERKNIGEGTARERGIPTGVKQFDNLLFHKGLGYQELTVFMAPAKRGKTLTIWDISKRIAVQGYNVLGITLEVGDKVMAQRLDANIGATDMGDLVEHYEIVEERVKKAAAKAGAFKIHQFASNSFRPDDLIDLIEYYKSQGIKFDLVTIDYLDIMAPNRRLENEIANNKSVWSDVRGIAQNEDFACLSATQTNRDGAKTVTAKDTDVAEDYNKIRIADLVISLNSTEDELKRGVVRWYMAASRNQRGGITITTKSDMAKMKALVDITNVE